MSADPVLFWRADELANFLSFSGVTKGRRSSDGRFEDDPSERHSWLIFDEGDDLVFWCPMTGEIASWEGRAFALNQGAIADPLTYTMGAALQIHASVRSWWDARGEGIFVLDWRRAFDVLRSVPRVEVAAELRHTYSQAMRTSLPKASFRRLEKAAA